MRRFFAVSILLSSLALAFSAVGSIASAVNGAPQATDSPAAFQESYRQIWNTVNDRYHGERSPNWHTTEHKFDGGITSGATLDAAVNQALKSMGDARLRALSLDEIEQFKSRQVSGYIGIGMSLDEHQVIGEDLLITGIEADSPAESTGLKNGDRIIAVDGTSVTGQKLNDVTYNQMRGDDGTTVVLTVKRADGSVAPVSIVRDLDGSLGIEVKDDKPRQLYLVRYVRAEAPAARAGLAENDIITHVNGKPVEQYSLEEALQLLREGHIGSTVTVNVLRDKKPLEIVVTREIVKSWDISLGFSQQSGGMRASGKDDSFSHLELKNLDWQEAPEMLDDFLEDIWSLNNTILDLRGADGNDAELAARVAARFMSADATVLSVEETVGGKAVVTTYELRQGRLIKKSGSDETVIEKIEKSYKGNLVVIANGDTDGTAAAIVQSLQHQKRARVVGSGSGNRAELTATVVFGERAVEMPAGVLKNVDGSSFASVAPDRRVWTGSPVNEARAELAGEAFFDDPANFVLTIFSGITALVLLVVVLVARRNKNRNAPADRTASDTTSESGAATADATTAKKDTTPAAGKETNTSRRSGWSRFLVLLLPVLLIGAMFGLPRLLLGPPAGATSQLIVEFYHNGDQASQRQAVVIEQLKSEYKGDIEFRTIDVRQNPDVTKSYDGKDFGAVQYVPAIRIVHVVKDKDGNEIGKGWQMGGKRTKRDLVRTIEYYSGKDDLSKPALNIERHKK